MEGYLEFSVPTLEICVIDSPHRVCRMRTFDRNRPAKISRETRLDDFVGRLLTNTAMCDQYLFRVAFLTWVSLVRRWTTYAILYLLKS